MKHLTTLVLVMVLCTSSFSQYVSVTSVAYDSTTYTSSQMYYAQVALQSAGVHTTTIKFFWSSDREELENGGGYLLQDSMVMGPGVFARSEQYLLYSSIYQPLVGDRQGIYFQVRFVVVSDEGVIVQSYESTTRTWRFPQDLSTSVEENSSVGYSMYPNPTTDRFQIKGFSGLVQITDVLGKSVLSTSLRDGETLDISALPSGTYIVTAGQTFLGRLQKI